MKRVSGLLLLFGFLGTAGSARAEPVPKKPVSQHRSSAKEGKRDEPSVDSELATSRSTAEVMLDLFADADVDRDGTVRREELQRVVTRAVQKRIAVRFRQLDKNRDGVVTRLEVTKMDARRFDRFDRNGDGSFTAEELALTMATQCAQQVDQVLARLDTDGSGQVTRTELMTGRERDERVAALHSEKPKTR